MVTTAGANDITVSLLNFCIVVMNENTAKACSGREIFRIVGTILILVRDSMIDDRYVVHLSEYCFNVCETLKNTIQGRNQTDLNESEKMVLEGLERAMHKIERTLRREAASMPYRYDKQEVEGHLQNVQQIVGVLHKLNPSFGEDPGMDESAPHLTSVNLRDSTTASPLESGCNTLAYGRLIRYAFTLRELPPVANGILSSETEDEPIHSLPARDAQELIDQLDRSLCHTPDLPSWTRKICLKLLYMMCGHHALLPSALKVPVCYDQSSHALYRGGYADVWKGEYHGQDTAVKVIRTYSNVELQKVINRFCKEVVLWRFLQHPNVIPLIGISMSENRFAMVSEWMIHGNINQYVEAHPEADRLSLLTGVARGLIYLHDNGMIHGDLKGANILIDGTGNALLADFGLLAIISDPANLLSSSSNAQGGTIRWMGPELIAPEQFGLEKSRPTKASDCYALGMVVYETVSGKLPFHKDTDFGVTLKVVKGERPRREAKFTDRLWGMVEWCWAAHPDDRPSVEDVLQCLEAVSDLRELPAQEGETFEESVHRHFAANIRSLVYSYSRPNL